MLYIFWNLLILQVIWAIRKHLLSILRGATFLLNTVGPARAAKTLCRRWNWLEIGLKIAHDNASLLWSQFKRQVPDCGSHTTGGCSSLWLGYAHHKTHIEQYTTDKSTSTQTAFHVEMWWKPFAHAQRTNVITFNNQSSIQLVQLVQGRFTTWLVWLLRII